MIDYPAGQTAGGVLDFWQRPVADLGLTGQDRGEGGAYLLGPSEDPARHRGSGRVLIRSATENVLIGLRLLDRDPAFGASFRDAFRMGHIARGPQRVRLHRGPRHRVERHSPRGPGRTGRAPRWYKCVDFGTSQETEVKLELDERTTWFYEAVTSSKGMVHPEPGAGQVHMTTKRDSHGDLLRADRTYRLRVPPAVPVRQFWSLTLYSEDSRRPEGPGMSRSNSCTAAAPSGRPTS